MHFLPQQSQQTLARSVDSVATFVLKDLNFIFLLIEADFTNVIPTTIMALAKSVYNLLFRRTSTFAITIMVGAVVFERMFDQGGDAIFEQLNRGVSMIELH